MESDKLTYLQPDSFYSFRYQANHVFVILGFTMVIHS